MRNKHTVDALEGESLTYVNKVVKILHECVDTWSGSVNKNDGDKYLFTWKIPDGEDSEYEKNETLQETKTEYADKSLIAAVKIVSEIRRARELTAYTMSNRVLSRYETLFRSADSDHTRELS